MKNKLSYNAKILYDNCLYFSIADAVASAQSDIALYEQSWDGFNYSFNFNIRNEGAVCFFKEPNVIVGAVRNWESARVGDYPKFAAEDLFADGGEKIKKIAANEPLQYLLYEFTISEKKLFKKEEKKRLPVATSAFWVVGGEFFSCDDEQTFLQNGGGYIKKMCAPREFVVEYILENFAELVTEKELPLVDFLYEAKRKNAVKISKGDLMGVVTEDNEGWGIFVGALGGLGFEIES